MCDLQKANEYKNLGNEAFKAHKYEEAIDLFSKAIECNPNDHVFYSNRSSSYLNAGEHQKALQDAERCVKLNPSWPRGYQRKGTALFYLERIDEAIETYKEGLKIDPNNGPLKQDLKAAENRKNQPMPQMNQQYLNAMIKLMSHPETKDFISDPQFMNKVSICMKNPQMAGFLIQNDPKMKKAFEVLSSPDAGSPDLEALKKMFAGQNFKSEQPKSEPAPRQEEKKPQPKPEKMEPEDPAENFKNKGNCEFQKKNFHEALNLYEQAVKLNPNEPLYYNNKAAAYIELKQLDLALQQIANAQKLFEEGVSKDYVKKAKVYARKASILAKQERFDESIMAYEKSLIEDTVQKVKDELLKVRKLKKEKEAAAYINPQIAEQNCELGNQYYKEGKFPLALKEYEQAIRRNPAQAKYYSNLGTTYIKLMQFQRAKENFEIALQKDPKYIKAYPKKGDCHFAMKEYHKALSTYEAGLKLDPQNQLCQQGIEKTNAAIYMSNSQEDQEQRAKRAMADPQIQAILQTPQVRNALQELQRDPKQLPHVLQNKNIATKLQKLIAAGVLRVG